MSLLTETPASFASDVNPSLSENWFVSEKGRLLPATGETCTFRQDRSQEHLVRLQEGWQMGEGNDVPSPFAVLDRDKQAPHGPANLKVLPAPRRTLMRTPEGTTTSSMTSACFLLECEHIGVFTRQAKLTGRTAHVIQRELFIISQNSLTMTSSTNAQGQSPATVEVPLIERTLLLP